MFFPGKEQVILGWDIAGKVVKIGKDVKKFNIGDNVFGMVNFPGEGKANAEFVASPEDHLALVPNNVTITEAAATTLAALTALQVLETRIKKGDRVLIHAGSGGVGHFAIQIAKYLGAYVITTSSSKNREFLISIGADEHIDYKSQKFEEVLTNIDFVLDPLGGENLINSTKVMKEGATLICLVLDSDSKEFDKIAKDKKITIEGILVNSNNKDMNTLKVLLENENLKPHIHKTFNFSELGKAHLEVEGGRVVGKVIVTV